MSTLPVPASRAAASAAAAPVEAPVPVATPVSVVMPVLNEERYLEQSVRRVLDQEYDGEVEVVLAVGPSHDRTAQIAEDLATRDGRVRVIRNATGRTPDALNAAVQASRHPYVVRVDAHGLLPAGYLTEVVRLLESTGAANVGGMMKVEGDNAFGHAVARAMSSPLGIGGSKFHVGGAPGPARTVYLGAFRREVLDRVGGFDPHFHRAQDWELNYRIRRAGGTVWFSPHLAVTYRPRRNVPALARQFHASGRWRRQIVERHPETASFRYLAAPVVTSCIIIGLVLGVAALLMGWPWLHLGWLAPACYLTGLLAACAVMGRGLSFASWLWLPLVTATMHLSWGVGFLRNIRR